jgi:hypothetical protein
MSLQVVNLVRNHIVEETIQATTPFLPYIYVCSSSPEVYNLTGLIYSGCGDDVSDTSLVLRNKPEGGSIRTDGFCVQETVTVQVRQRALRICGYLVPRLVQKVTYRLLI